MSSDEVDEQEAVYMALRSSTPSLEIGRNGAHGYVHLFDNPRLERFARLILDKMPSDMSLLAMHGTIIQTTSMKGGTTAAIELMRQMPGRIVVFASCYSGAYLKGGKLPKAGRASQAIGRPVWGIVGKFNDFVEMPECAAMRIFYPDGASVESVGREFLHRGELGGYIDGALPLPIVDAWYH